MTKFQKLLITTLTTIGVVQLIVMFFMIGRFHGMQRAHKEAVDAIPAGIERGIQKAVAQLPVARIEIAEEPTVVPQKLAGKLHQWDDPKFRKSYVRTKDFSELRAVDYGTGSKHVVRISTHRGGKSLDHKQAWETISAVLERMPNIRSTDELKLLCYETMVTETGLGREKVDLGIKLWRNYGIAQFRTDTARETLDWLKVVRPDVYKATMSFYDKKLSLVDNLSFNVPFSIALMVQYYWRAVPDLYANIGTMDLRAELWASAYNTSKGLGTVNDYRGRVTRHFQRLEAANTTKKS